MKVALCGKMGSGKSYVSTHLVNINYIRLGFGDAVKKYCKEIFNMDYKDRQLLQKFAKSMRDIDPDVWVKYIENKINLLDSSDIIVDDVRYPNEYNFLKKKKFIIIKLNIETDFQKERLIKAYPSTYNEHFTNINDLSESYIDNIDCDYVININKNEENNVLSIVDNIILNNKNK